MKVGGYSTNEAISMHMVRAGAMATLGTSHTSPKTLVEVTEFVGAHDNPCRAIIPVRARNSCARRAKRLSRSRKLGHRQRGSRALQIYFGKSLGAGIGRRTNLIFERRKDREQEVLSERRTYRIISGHCRTEPVDRTDGRRTRCLMTIIVLHRFPMSKIPLVSPYMAM